MNHAPERFRCRTGCRDTGWLLVYRVWHERGRLNHVVHSKEQRRLVVSEIDMGEIARRSMAVPCHCEAGSVFVFEPGAPKDETRGRRPASSQYHESRFCRFGGDLAAWCEEVTQAWFDLNREPAFDDFNAGV